MKESLDLRAPGRWQDLPEVPQPVEGQTRLWIWDLLPVGLHVLSTTSTVNTRIMFMDLPPPLPLGVAQGLGVHCIHNHMKDRTLSKAGLLWCSAHGYRINPVGGDHQADSGFIYKGGRVRKRVWPVIKTSELWPRGSTCWGPSPSCLSAMPHMPSISKVLEHS